MNRTKILLLVTVGFLAVNAFASDDPVKDFLSGPKYFTRLPGYYTTDRLYRLDIDLQGNGQTVTLVTFSRDQDGQQGNVWNVYKKGTDGYQSIGSITFSPNNFYLGKIDQINSYGLVAVGTAGGGEGRLTAYIDDGDSIRSVDLTGLQSFDDMKKAGSKYAQYFKNITPLDKMTDVAQGIKVLTAQKLSEEYGLHLEKQSYYDAASSGFKGITP